MSISTADLKNGTALLIAGKPCMIIEVQQVKP
ncbi:MAG: hypothetical protein LBP91_06060, partial [Coriobacteriales bacterium]|nr:hypothetical protein [Coriobacteriales bacterium]